MLKKSIVATIIVGLLFVIASEPSVLAAAAETTEGAKDAEKSGGLIRIVLNVLSVATLAVFAFLITTDRG